MKDKISKFDNLMKVVGVVETDGTLIVEGELEGHFTGNTLTVTDTGSVIGEVKGEKVECAGRIEGNVVTKVLQLKRGACQVGTVVTGELEVEAGALIDCVLNNGSAQQARPEKSVKVEVAKRIDLSGYLKAFAEESRPCCLEVPWSERMELYNHVQDLLVKGKRLVKVVGHEGSGKTEFAKKLLAEPPQGYIGLELEEKVGSVTTLLKEVCEKLGLQIPDELTGQADLLEKIRTEIRVRSKAGERLVLIVDDAQQMFQATMEGLTRLLSGAFGEEELETEASMQIILFGSSELKENMVATILEYFEDETNCQLTLDPLSMKDTAEYLRLGLQLASRGDDETAMSLLENEAIKEMHLRSEGSIARVNELINKALKKAHAAQKSSITPELIKELS